MISTREVLKQQIVDLLAEIEMLRAELAPFERELEIAQRALTALDSSEVRPPDHPASGNKAGAAPGQYRNAYRRFYVNANATMKDLIRRALRERFPKGAKASQLVELFNKEWGRPDIVRSSLSPQLSRLKKDHEIILDGEVWRLPIEDEDEDDRGKLPLDSDTQIFTAAATATDFVECLLGSAGQLDLGGKTNTGIDQ